MSIDWALYTDLYQLTMTQSYWKAGREEEQAAFNMYFRDYPFNGGFAIACGISQLKDVLSEYRFSEEDIDYLASLKAPLGGDLFDAEFLDYLRDFKFSIEVSSVSEGTVVFPNEPIVRVTGPLMQCQMIETALLNVVSFQTLIATKAARICLASGDHPVTEFGLRRAQGLGGIWASRAAYIGGCAGTSNVLAGRMFDIPVSGTHSHSWVMSFDSELEAFREYARVFPNNCSLLVDTYDVEAGIDNAITVAQEMQKRGESLSSIRIDSGDLSWLAKRAREKLDAAGLFNVKIMLTNDLDEFTMMSILNEGAPVDIWGVGTKLATAYDQPTLGGVYKLSAIKQPGGVWEDRLKISESQTKLTTPGVLDIRRYYDNAGMIAGDMVFDVNSCINSEEIIVDPFDPLRQKKLSGKTFETLLHPIFEDGKVVSQDGKDAAKIARDRAKEGLSKLDETQLRLLNPHTYPVGLEKGLHDRRQDLIAKLRSVDR